MRESNINCLREHLKYTIKDTGIFNRVFSKIFFDDIIKTLGFNFRNRIFTPETLIWGFVNQILSEDHSCKSAVASIIARLKVNSNKLISSSTGAYCQARSKLPIVFFETLGFELGRLLNSHYDFLKWKGFNVKLIDGSDLKLPVTKQNLKLYSPCTNSTGLLKCRILGIFSLSHGGLLDFAVGPFKGKGTGEVSLLRKLYDNLHKGDLAIMDRLFCTFFEMSNFQKRGIEFVIRKSGNMKTDFRKGESLGHEDHIIEINRPWNRQDSIIFNQLETLPRKIRVRELRVRIKRKGFRVKSLYIFTSLLDPQKYLKEDLAELFKKRWNVEVDFRSLKTFLKMDILRCKCPEMISKEIWMHVITYNYLRTVMVDAALVHGVYPREISFKETVQMVRVFRPYMAISGSRKRMEYYFTIIESLLDRVGNRPGRIEPRLVRNNTMNFRLLKKPRNETRKGFWKSGWAREKRNKDKKRSA